MQTRGIHKTIFSARIFSYASSRLGALGSRTFSSKCPFFSDKKFAVDDVVSKNKKCPHVVNSWVEEPNADNPFGIEKPYKDSPYDCPSDMQTHAQGPWNADGHGPMKQEELDQRAAELEKIKEMTGWAEPDRGPGFSNPSPDTKWRFGKPPNYTVTNLEKMLYSLTYHEEGSLELVVENLVKTWEGERSHMTDIRQHAVANHEGFRLSANNGYKFNHAEAAEHGNYNAILESADPSLWDVTKIWNRQSHEIFHGAFPAFAWEILDVYTGPPKVEFSWRHFGRFTGTYKGHKGKCELIEVFDTGVTIVNEDLQLMDTQVFYDQDGFLEILEGKKGVEDAGSEVPSRDCKEFSGSFGVARSDDPRFVINTVN